MLLLEGADGGGTGCAGAVCAGGVLGVGWGVLGTGPGTEVLPEPLPDVPWEGCSDGVVGSVVGAGGVVVGSGGGVVGGSGDGVGFWLEVLSSEGAGGSEGDSLSPGPTVTVHVLS